MNIGLDIGYSAVKAVSGGRRVTFPSGGRGVHFTHITLRGGWPYEFS